MSDPIIKIENMNKWFGDFQVLKDINLSVEKNKKIVVCGPSGSGKSTLIRCVNRLEEHQKGSIIVDGTELNENTKKEISKKPFSYKRSKQTKIIHLCKNLDQCDIDLISKKIIDLGKKKSFPDISFNND